MMRAQLKIAILVGALLGGCSLVVDSGKYTGGTSSFDAFSSDAGPLPDGPLPDRGTFDGGPLPDTGPLPDGELPDAGPNMNGPTAPVVAIMPSSPGTNDDLVATIVTPSTDPQGGTVRYEYAWVRNGFPVPGQTGMTVPAALTIREEVWSVRVTPIADPGGRVGAAATSPDVEIRNTVPLLRGVGLNSYMPIAGETIRALPGDVEDADGDSAGIRFEWFVHADPNDGNIRTPITGQTRDDLSTLALVPGNLVSLDAWANDGEDGPRVSVGPVRLLEPGPRWRPLLPSRGNDVGATYYDPINSRLVRLINGELWETVISSMPGSSGSMRSVYLPSAGAPPRTDGEGQVQLFDPVNRRILFYDFDEPTQLWSVPIDPRGADLQWTTFTPGGAGPPLLGFSSSIYHPGTGRIFVLSIRQVMGADGGTAFESFFASLGVRTPGAESWNTHATTGDVIPPVAFGGLALDPTSPEHIYIFGGAELSVDQGQFRGSRRIFRVRVAASGPLEIEEVATLLPSGLVAPAVYTDPEENRIYLFGGATSFTPGSVPGGLLRFDVVTRMIEPLGLPPSDAYIFNTLVPDGDEFAIGGLVFDFNDNSTRGRLARLRRDGTITVVATEDALSRAFVSAIGRLEYDRISIYGGRDYDETLRTEVGRDELWTLDLGAMRWSLQPTTTDSVFGTRPEGRYGFSAQTTAALEGYSMDLNLLGGLTGRDAMTSEDIPASSDVWMLDYDRRWIHRRLRAGEPPLPMLSGHQVFQVGGCSRVGYVGGFVRPVGGFHRGSGVLQCFDPEGRSCAWEPLLNTPAVANGAAAGHPQGPVYVFGGDTETGVSNTAWYANICSGARMWMPTSSSGSIPSARRYHSLTMVGDPSTQAARLFVFGGQSSDPEDTQVYVGHVDISSDASASAVSWEVLAVLPGPLPEPREEHLMFYDHQRKRLLLIGGRGRRELSDVWELIID